MPEGESTRDTLSDVALPSSAERQREIERILKLVPGTLDPEKVALRARAREAHELLWLRMVYRVCEVETFENPHPTQQRRGEKE